MCKIIYFQKEKIINDMMQYLEKLPNANMPMSDLFKLLKMQQTKK